jgi:hypothetical protein
VFKNIVFIDEVEELMAKLLRSSREEPEMIVYVNSETEGRGFNERSTTEIELMKNIL